MTKTEHIEYWKISAGKSLSAARHLFEAACFVDCLYWLHLSLEKALKAHWVKDNQKNSPPRTEDLKRLVEQTALSLTPSQAVVCDQMNAFQLDFLYPDYEFSIYRDFDEPRTKRIFSDAETLFHSLLDKLPQA